MIGTGTHNHTQRPFTLVVCTGCRQTPDGTAPEGILDALGSAVRLCRHGVLVSVPCLMGAAICAGRTTFGSLAALQPCSVDRAPDGCARVVGPIRNRLDAERLRTWVRDGDWNLGLLPHRMRNPFAAENH